MKTRCVLAFTLIATQVLSAVDFERLYLDNSKLTIETGSGLVEKTCERVTLEYPGLLGRGEAVGMAIGQDSRLYVLVVATVGGAGSEIKPAQRLFQSADGGRTWTGHEVTLPTGTAASFLVLSDGSMLMSANQAVPDGHGAVNIYRSTDNGARWKEIARVPADPYTDIISESLTQIRDGTILMPADRITRLKGSERATLTERFKDYNHLVFRSENGGLNWIEGGRTYDGVAETHLIELDPGRILGAFRFSGPYRDWHRLKAVAWGARPEADGAGRIFKQVLLGESDDAGLTWNALHPVVDQYDSPLLVFGETHGQLLKLEDGKVLLVSDHRYPYQEAETVAWVSSNNGNTWSREIYHLIAGSGYAASTVFLDGTVVTVAGSTKLDAKSKPIEPWKVQSIRWKP